MKPKIKLMLSMLLVMFSAIALRAQVACEANFQWSVNPNGVYSFYDSSFTAQGYVISQYQWNFGNGYTSVVQNPTQQFTTAGTYNVCLVITSQLQGSTITCVDTVCKSIVVGCSTYIGGSFSFTVQQQTVAFSSNYSSNYPPLSYTWVFGDGASSSLPNPTHTYANQGTYQVCVTVSDSFGCSKTECKNVIIGTATCNLQAYFTSTQPGPNTLVVTSQTTGGNVASNIHVWKLNGVVLGTTTGNGNSHTFSPLPANTPDGNLQLCLRVETPNAPCQDSFCKTITICRANGEFAYNVLANDTIKFTPPANMANIYSHKWYANGNLFSTDISPKVKFSNSFVGMTICHVVSNAQVPSCKDSFCTVLQAQPCNANAQFQFLTDTNGITKFYPVTNATNWSHTWIINNDTVIQNSISPALYLSPDTYNVCHIIALNGNPNCIDTICQQVIVRNAPPCNLHITIAKSVNPNMQVLLEASAINMTGAFTYNWSNGSSTKVINVTNNYGVYCVTVTEAGSGCTATACFNYQPNAPLDTICGITFNDANGNGVLDSTESPMSIRIYINGNGQQLSVVSDSVTGEWHAYLPAGTYNVCAYVANSGTTGGWVATLPVSQNNNGLSPSACYTVNIAPNQNLCGFNFGFQNTKVTICGYVYIDVNANGVKDSTEYGIQGQAVKVGNYTVYTNADGYYRVNIPAGTYTVNYTPISPYTGYTALPANYTIAATTIGQPYCGNNFGIQVPSGQCDVAVDLAPLSTVTPGFRAIYTIKVFNLNGYTTSGLLTFNFEPGLTFYSAAPAQSSFDNSAATVTWNVSNIAPGTYKSFTVRLNTPQNFQLGTPVFSFAEFTTNGNCTETNLNNNIDTTHQTVVASYDPNDKHVSPEGNIANNGQELAYTIRFQNTGTAPAVNVVILDTLNDNLDWSTFEFKNASHSCNIQQEGNLVSFIFSNIMLPDSLQNEAESHGFVSYKIKAQQNLPNATRITNSAAIYFDFNEAIHTNTTLNTVDFSLSVKNVNAKQPTITVSPNPFKTYTNILVNGAEASPIEIEVRDLAGRTVVKQISESNLIQLQTLNLASGMYVYELKQNNGVIGTGKMIAQ
ncbi:MAG: PKD domain-containing protein [Chitinophagales bacterium]|nr:PKD domain-containing protein [Chitinophagales bacterium]